MLLSTVSTAVMALAVLVPSVTAVPTFPWGEPRGQPAYQVPNLSKLAKIMPKSTLPTPDGLQLKFVGLGLGTQNYTCNPGNMTAEPGTVSLSSPTHHLT